jgi:CBS domain-containing protein
MRVEDIMSRPVLTCHPSQAAAEAARLMREGDVGCIPIVSTYDVLLGIVTDRDLCLVAAERDLKHVPLGDVMHTALETCQVGESSDRAETQMVRARVRRIPIVDDEARLVGILSLGDLACAREMSWGTGAKEHLLAELAHTLAAVARPRPVNA